MQGQVEELYFLFWSEICIDKSINYINERKQFGSYLKEFQNIQFKIADMITHYCINGVKS